MNRRGFLGLFGCLPFLGFLKKEKKEGLKVQDLLDYRDKLPLKRSGTVFIAEVDDWPKSRLQPYVRTEVDDWHEHSFSFGDYTEPNYKCTYFIDGKEVTPEQWQEFVWEKTSFLGTELVWGPAGG